MKFVLEYDDKFWKKRYKANKKLLTAGGWSLKFSTKQYRVKKVRKAVMLHGIDISECYEML